MNFTFSPVVGAIDYEINGIRLGTAEECTATVTVNRAYSVGRWPDGTVSWWPTWTQRGGGETDVRYATIEEGELMAKCDWEKDTAADRLRLSELLSSSQPGHTDD